MRRVVTAFAFILASLLPLSAQHLWWDSQGREDHTCLYGEITVLETMTFTYFCGANWHPGEAAGGYCGIQNTDTPDLRLNICSVWDTAEGLIPQITYTMPNIKVAQRFGGEGEGAQTLHDWPWKVGETFRFYARKRPGTAPDTTDLDYFAYHPTEQRWIHMSTITSPNGGYGSVQTLTNLASFLENYMGLDRDAPRLVLYRLWSGTSVDNLSCITRASGDGIWGRLGNAYFLADGKKPKLNSAFRRWQKIYGKPVMGPGTRKKPVGPIPDQPIPAQTLTELRAL